MKQFWMVRIFKAGKEVSSYLGTFRNRADAERQAKKDCYWLGADRWEVAKA